MPPTSGSAIRSRVMICPAFAGDVGLLGVQLSTALGKCADADFASLEFWTSPEHLSRTSFLRHAPPTRLQQEGINTFTHPPYCPLVYRSRDKSSRRG